MEEKRCMAFVGTRCVGYGPLPDVAGKSKDVLDDDPTASVLVFDADTAQPIEVDFRGTASDVLERLGVHAEPEPRRPGRPKLGVVAREVTLLPRHWEWLGRQPGGASVTLRRLVDEARRANHAEEERREAREAAYRFMFAVAGNEPGFEEATRALFAGDGERFVAVIADWPPDVREHAARLAAPAFEGESA